MPSFTLGRAVRRAARAPVYYPTPQETSVRVVRLRQQRPSLSFSSAYLIAVRELRQEHAERQAQSISSTTIMPSVAQTNTEALTDSQASAAQNGSYPTAPLNCHKCKKLIDLEKQGGVLQRDDVNYGRFYVMHIECYQEQRARLGTHNHSYIFPKEYRLRQRRSRERSLAFYRGNNPRCAMVGVEIETESGIWLDDKDFEECDRIQSIGSDGSISSWGVELRTQPSAGEEFKNMVDQVYGRLKKLRWAGSKATGMHNHVDFANPSGDEVKRMFLLGYLLEPFILAHLPANRRNGSYCKSITKLFTREEIMRIADSDVDKLYYSMGSEPGKLRMYKSAERLNFEKRSHGNSARYVGLNLHSVYYRGTVEFRYPHTVIDETHAYGFGFFFASMVEYVRSGAFTIDKAKKLSPRQLIKDMIACTEQVPSMQMLIKLAPKFLEKKANY